jgi:hypothetical protein
MIAHKKNTEAVHERICYIEYGFFSQKHEKKIEKIGNDSPMPCFIYVDRGSNNVIQIFKQTHMWFMSAVEKTDHGKIIPQSCARHRTTATII